MDVDRALGAILRDLREQQGVPQHRVAEDMRAAGFAWSQPTVAAVEAGLRSLSVRELLALTAIIGVAATEVLGAVDPAAVAHDRAVMDRQTAVYVPLLEQAGVKPTQRARMAVLLTAKSPIERRVGHRIGLTPEQVTALALRLWDRTLEAERDARAPEGANVMDKSHVTRKLQEELRVIKEEVGW